MIGERVAGLGLEMAMKLTETNNKMTLDKTRSWGILRWWWRKTEMEPAWALCSQRRLGCWCLICCHLRLDPEYDTCLSIGLDWYECIVRTLGSEQMPGGWQWPGGWKVSIERKWWLLTIVHLEKRPERRQKVRIEEVNLDPKGTGGILISLDPGVPLI